MQTVTTRSVSKVPLGPETDDAPLSEGGVSTGAIQIDVKGPSRANRDPAPERREWPGSASL